MGGPSPGLAAASSRIGPVATVGWGARLGAALAAASLLAVLVAPAGSAQGRDGDFAGTVTDLEGVAFTNRVSITVGGGTMRGVVRLVVPSEITFGGTIQPTCYTIVADFTARPLRLSGSRASGPVPLTQGLADRACADGLRFDSEEGTGEFAATVDGDILTGTLAFAAFGAGGAPVTYRLRATRSATAPAPAPTTAPGVPAIGEFIDAAPLTEETIRVLQALEACEPRDLQSGGRCAFRGILGPAREGLTRLGVDPALIDEAIAVQEVAMMTDPSGRPLVPSLERLLPVIKRLARQPDGQGLPAMRRLVALVVAMDLEARR